MQTTQGADCIAQIVSSAFWSRVPDASETGQNIESLGMSLFFKKVKNLSFIFVLLWGLGMFWRIILFIT